jgi:hypothetical protein
MKSTGYSPQGCDPFFFVAAFSGTPDGGNTEKMPSDAGHAGKRSRSLSL